MEKETLGHLYFSFIIIDHSANASQNIRSFFNNIIIYFLLEKESFYDV